MVGVKSDAFPFLILIYTKMYLTMYRICNFIEHIIIKMSVSGSKHVGMSMLFTWYRKIK